VSARAPYPIGPMPSTFARLLRYHFPHETHRISPPFDSCRPGTASPRIRRIFWRSMQMTFRAVALGGTASMTVKPCFAPFSCGPGNHTRMVMHAWRLSRARGYMRGIHVVYAILFPLTVQLADLTRCRLRLSEGFHIPRWLFLNRTLEEVTRKLLEMARVMAPI
jgi:hypothetical protein